MMAMVATMMHHAVDDEVDPGDPPSGPPTSGLEYTYGGSLVGLSWANGDVLANTQIGYAASGEPSSVTTSVAPGTTTYETGGSTSGGWWVRHIRNGQTSAWAQVFTEE